MTDSAAPKSPQWTTGTELDGPRLAVHGRTGKPLERRGQEYLHGTVFALDEDGKQAGHQHFDVYPISKVVLLESADVGLEAGNNGVDNRGQGAGRAMLDELDRLYPEPEWVMASSEFADHTQAGIDFMRSRSLGGRRKVHTETCAIARRENCGCEFADELGSSDGGR